MEGENRKADCNTWKNVSRLQLFGSHSRWQCWLVVVGPVTEAQEAEHWMGLGREHPSVSLLTSGPPARRS